MFFVVNIDDSDSEKPAKGKSARKPLDLDAPTEPAPEKSGKPDGKLEILRDPDSKYRGSRPAVDPVKERKRRTILTVALLVATFSAIAVITIYFFNRKPTFQNAVDAPLPITSNPTLIQQPGANRATAPVLPNTPPSNSLNTMPGLNPGGEDRETDRPAGGIH